MFPGQDQILAIFFILMMFMMGVSHVQGKTPLNHSVPTFGYQR